MRISKWQLAATVVILTGGVYGCANGDNATPAAPSTTESVTGGGGGGSSSGTASLTIRLTDSPYGDAKSLLVTFSEVSVHRADPGEWTTIPFTAGSSRTCDLKKLQGGVNDLLGVGQLPAGKYTQIRLTVTNAELFFDSPTVGSACAVRFDKPAGRSASVDVPSGQVKLNNEFTLTSAGSTILLDFDGDQSVRQTGSGNGNGNGNGQGNANANSRYMMTPVIRVVSVR